MKKISILLLIATSMLVSGCLSSSPDSAMPDGASATTEGESIANSKAIVLPVMEFQTDIQKGGVYIWANAMKLDYGKCSVDFFMKIRGQGFVLPSEAYVHLATQNEIGGVEGLSDKERQCVYEKLQDVMKKSKGQIVPKGFKTDFDKYFSAYNNGGFKPTLLKAK